MVDFADLTYPEQLFELEGRLPAILALLTRPAPTAVVAGRLARDLGCMPSLASTLLLRLAATGKYGATHDGEVKRRFGQRQQGWRWHPHLPTAQSPGSILVNPQDPPPAEDWTAPAAPAKETEEERRDRAAYCAELLALPDVEDEE